MKQTKRGKIHYIEPGMVAAGSLAAGFTTADLDAQTLVASFGGEEIVDILAALVGGGQAFGDFLADAQDLPVMDRDIRTIR